MTSVCEVGGVAHGGHGVCRIDGRVCFVPYALPGDVVEVAVVRESRRVLWGEIVDVVERSPHREDVLCPVFGECGGCTWLHFAYPGQSEWKRRIVLDCLNRIGGIETDCKIVEDPELRIAYRTRAEFHTASGRWGFFAGRSHDVVDIERCPLCHERVNAAFSMLRAVDVNEAVEITVNPEGEETLVWSKHRQQALQQIFPAACSRADDGERPKFLFDGIPVVTGAFSQSSLPLQRLLIGVVAEMVGDASSVLDLFCGSGAMSLGLTANARVAGLDHNRSAVTAAANLGSGDYRVGGETEFRTAIESGGWDVVLLDPPRAGAKSIVDALAGSSARSIVYVSCDPATLARDLRGLTGAGWRVRRTVAIDMFPQTSHVETVCRLER
jgi:23S rRNA (uracil1939-C5)-methyltransferase